MEILLNTSHSFNAETPLLFKKMDKDERIVRKRLVQVWTEILEKYARPGMPLPSIEAIRRELLDIGVDAAVSAVVSEHWWLFSGMVRDDIHGKVERGLARFKLAEFLEEVKMAQNDPGMLAHLREKIRRYVMEDL